MRQAYDGVPCASHSYLLADIFRQGRGIKGTITATR
jgi:hypothetical protein